MEIQKEPVLIAFSTQKGGVGKSTFTALTASILHYRLGYNVAVFDCDFPQHSLVQMRERDLKAIMENETYKKLAYRQFSTINKKAYPVIKCSAEQALGKIKTFIGSSPVPFDVIFVDLPGTVNTPGVLTALAGVHHIFSPMTADRVVVESALSFTEVLTNILMKKSKTSIRSIQLFWNQVDGREKSTLYEVYEKIISELGLTLMASYVTDSKKFRKEGEASSKTVFRSTLLPADDRLMKACRLDLFIQEFLKIVKL